MAPSGSCPLSAFIFSFLFRGLQTFDIIVFLKPGPKHSREIVFLVPEPQTLDEKCVLWLWGTEHSMKNLFRFLVRAVQGSCPEFRFLGLPLVSSRGAMVLLQGPRPPNMLGFACGCHIILLWRPTKVAGVSQYDPTDKKTRHCGRRRGARNIWEPPRVHEKIPG